MLSLTYRYSYWASLLSLTAGRLSHDTFTLHVLHVNISNKMVLKNLNEKKNGIKQKRENG